MSRITNAMLTNNYLRDMQINLSNMSTLQQQLSSGKKVQNVADDPVGATKIMMLNGELTANEQYSTNISDASNWLDTTDTALGEAGNVLSRIRTLMVKAGNGSYGTDEISAIKDEVVSDVQQLGQVLNTSFNGNYIFGGTKSTSKPVVVDTDGNMNYADVDGNAISQNTSGSTTVTTVTLANSNKMVDSSGNTIGSFSEDSATGTITINYSNGSTSGTITTTAGNLQTDLTSYGFTAAVNESNKITSLLSNVSTSINQIGDNLTTEISEGIKVNYNQNAVSLLQFNDNNLTPSSINTMNVLKNILSDLGTLSDTSSSTTVKNTATTDLNEAALDQIDSVISNFLSARSKIGAMQNRMESVATTNSDQNYNMTSILSNTQDVDITEKTVEYSSAQTVYTAALQVSSTVLTKTIMDYI
ncbi:flagellar hook-associated protein FlgL [Clostridium sp.]|uniref:flagellar hook-associated protein FlgL n=1 Tax=Clostridium sp. TaxID=1506 RepID=UPI002601A63B|nr:flagellar hook-associated protein FlgL [Clostridium sp.]